MSDDLRDENRALRRRLAALNVGIRPEAAAHVGPLVDWENIDQDDDVALERALAELRGEHGYLFGSRRPNDIRAGAKNHRLPAEPPDPRSRLTTDERRRGEIDFNELHPGADPSPAKPYGARES